MDIQDVIKNIESNKYNEKKLIVLYGNINKKEGLSEEDKEVLIEAIEKNTRLRFPRAAKRIFGLRKLLLIQYWKSLIKNLSNLLIIPLTN